MGTNPKGYFKGLFLGWHRREKFGSFLKQEGGIVSIFQGIILW